MKDRIKQVRKDAGMTQPEFGDILKISKNFVVLLENGTRLPSKRTKELICEKFNVNIDWLENGTGSMYQPKTEDEELAKFFAEVMTEQPEAIRKRWAVAFSKLTPQQWENLADLAQTLLGE